MNYTRLYTDEHGDSRFEDVEIELNDSGIIGSLSEHYPVKTLQFRKNPADFIFSIHPGAICPVL